jgi:5-methylcytosine-specific restriction protein A
MPKRPPTLKVNRQPVRKGWASTTRKSRAARGYGPDWDRKRAAVLKREPTCRLCRAEGIATPAVTVDHIRPKHLGGKDDDSNLQPLCKPCHKIKTAAEAVEAQRVKRMNARRA